MYIAKIDSWIGETDCVIGVIAFNKVPPDRYADSDMDFYGYTECEFDVLGDLEMTEADRVRIEAEIEEFFEEIACNSL